jgi:DNA-binding MarR family transcriptional regulator
MNKNPLECCLFFSANSLARIITRMGEEEFARVGMTPSYAFLLTLAVDRPGISQKELAAQLHMAPSTVSRFVDALVAKGLIAKETEGRNTYIHPTEPGLALQPSIEKAWRGLHDRYSAILGREEGDLLAELTSAACRKLQSESSR